MFKLNQTIYNLFRKSKIRVKINRVPIYTNPTDPMLMYVNQCHTPLYNLLMFCFFNTPSIKKWSTWLWLTIFKHVYVNQNHVPTISQPCPMSHDDNSVPPRSVTPLPTPKLCSAWSLGKCRTKKELTDHGIYNIWSDHGIFMCFNGTLMGSKEI